ISLENYSEIRDNSIVKNGSYGIESYYDPNINSNIIYYNNTGGQQLNGSFTKVNYNCIQNYTGGGTGNTSQLPQFKNADANDFHLTSASTYCINAGNPYFTPDTNETDIDGEARIMLNRVDMGADEFYHSAADIAPNPVDGYVNFLDFAALAGGWQNNFDIYDLAVLAEDWLWVAGWNLDNGIGGDGAYFAEAECPLEGGQMMMMSMQSQSLSVSPQLYVGGSSESAISAEPFDVNETLNWLDDLWQADESIRNSIDANSWQEFIDAIKNSEE
ncbi:MAG: hypothetical protein WCW64_04205, partial [Phycisphaerae bacterium]